MFLRTAIIAIYATLAAFIAFGQCPEGLNVQSVIDSKDIRQLEGVAQQLSPCPDSAVQLAFVYHHIGIRYYLEDQFDSAIEATKKSLAIRKKVLPENDIQTAKSHNNLGVFYSKSYDFPDAIRHLREAVGIYETKNSSRMVGSYRELASIYRKRGDFEQAKNYLELAIEKSVLYDVDQSLAVSYLDFGEVLLSIGNNQSALDTLKKGIAIYAGLTEKSYNDKLNEAGCFLNSAYAYDELDDRENAMFFYQKAVNAYQDLDDPESVAACLNNIGVLLTRSGQMKQALDKLNQALEKGEDVPTLTAMVYDNIGDIHLRSGDHQKAIDFYGKAILKLLPSYETKEVPALGDKETLSAVTVKEDLLTYLTDMAYALKENAQKTRNQEQLTRALQHYELADKLTDIMRFEQSSTASKLFWRKEVRPIYESALEACHVLKDHEQAFYFMEKSKAILLLDALLGIDARTVVPDSIADREFQLKVRLQQGRSELDLALEAGSKDVETYRKAVADAIEANDLFIERIRQDHPQYFDVKYQLEVSSASDFFDRQENDGFIIQYFYGDRHVYILLSGMQESRLLTIDRSVVDQDISDFIRSFEQRHTILNNPKAFERTALKLYETIFPAFSTRGLPGGSTVTIIPDGPLSFIPFEALTYQSSSASVLGKMPYLVKKYDIRYGYSATIISRQIDGGFVPKRPAEFIGFAPFTVPAPDFPALSNSEDELKSIKNQFSGDYYFGEAANSGIFKSSAGDFGIIHLSTHASADGKQPFIAFLNEKLKLSELYTMQLPAELVVLSACQTGLGQFNEGEGVMSLARGFTYAGSKRLISSLWSVNDASTAFVFNHFYEHLDKGLSTSAALRQAKLDYLEDPDLGNTLKSPYFWAGFTMIGPDGVIELKRRGMGMNYFWMIPGILALMLIGYWGYKRIR